MREHASITLVLGRRGHGKSAFLKKALLPELNEPVVVIDPKGEYAEDNGFPIREQYYTVEEFLRAPKFWRASLRIEQYEVTSVLEALYHYSPHTIVIEEAHLYCSPHSIDPALSKLIRMGRLPNISTILVSQRVRDFPQIIYSMADKLIVFQQKSEHDVEALENILGEELSEIKNLPRDQFKEFEL